MVKIGAAEYGRTIRSRHLTLSVASRKYGAATGKQYRMARISSLAEAIQAAVRDGDTVAMEGFTHLIPHAAGHEIIRQGRKRLTLIRMTPDLIYDQLIGMGCVDKLIFSWGGNPGVGSLHRFRDAVENGWPQQLALEEHSHAAMANAYEAGAAGLPCAIFRGYIGGDLPKVNANIKRVTCPFTGEELAAIPAHPAGRGGDPCAARRQSRQCDDRGRARRAEGSRAGGEALGGDGRGDRRRSGRAQPQRGGAAALDRRPRGRGAGRRVSVLCAGLLPAQQRLLQGVGRDREGTRHVPGLDEDKRAGERPRGLRAQYARKAARAAAE